MYRMVESTCARGQYLWPLGIFLKFKKHEKHTWTGVTFSNVAGFHQSSIGIFYVF